ncbi:unnamed protein product [Caenorhabditis brenneri]
MVLLHQQNVVPCYSSTKNARKLAEIVEYDESRVELGAHSIFVREARPPGTHYSKASVIFLHGQSFSSLTWMENNMLRTFAALGYRAIAIDLPGSGQTRGAVLTQTEKPSFLMEFIETLGLRQVMIVSASMASQYVIPSMVSRRLMTCVVLIAPSNTHEVVRPSLYVVPTLVLWGERDTSLGPTAAANLKSLPSDNVNPKDIIGELEDGAFGEVEKAVSRTDPKLFAASKSIEIKEGEELQYFLVEIEILTECKGHPGMLGLHSTYYFDNKLTMLLEFCGGGAVDKIIIKLCRAFEEDEVRYFGYYVCDALKWLHSQNSKREKRDTFIGTPYWMAPKVLACENFEDQPYDSISDIWSLGITLIEISKCLDHSAAKFLNNVHRADPPCATITSIFIQPIRKTELLFSEWLPQSLVKNPRSRSSAAQLSDHLWFKDAPTKRTTILELLKKPISTQQVVSDIFKVPMLPPTIETPPPDTPHKKRAAPPPPQEAVIHQQSPVLNGKSEQTNSGERLITIFIDHDYSLLFCLIKLFMTFRVFLN